MDHFDYLIANQHPKRKKLETSASVDMIKHSLAFRPKLPKKLLDHLIGSFVLTIS